MSTTTVLAVIASTWGVAMAAAPVLQIRHMVAAHSSQGISIGYLTVLLIGFVLWLAYGVALDNWAIIIPNVLAFAVDAATIAVARHYRGVEPELGLSGEAASPERRS